MTGEWSGSEGPRRSEASHRLSLANVRKKGVIHDEHRARAGEGHNETEYVEAGRFRCAEGAEDRAGHDRAGDAEAEIPDQTVAGPDEELAGDESGSPAMIQVPIDITISCLVSWTRSADNCSGRVGTIGHEGRTPRLRDRISLGRHQRQHRAPDETGHGCSEPLFRLNA